MAFLRQTPPDPTLPLIFCGFTGSSADRSWQPETLHKIPFPPQCNCFAFGFRAHSASFKQTLKAGKLSPPEKSLSGVQELRDKCFYLHLSHTQFRVSISQPPRGLWQNWLPIAHRNSHSNTSYTSFAYFSLSFLLLPFSSPSPKRSFCFEDKCLHWSQLDNPG